MKCIALILLLVVPAFCGVKVGEPAPPIHLQALIPNQPVAATLQAMKGRAVVLEFWATSCGPCVDAIPHLNELVVQFASKPIQFLSVTDEEPAEVQQFLKSHPMRGLVGTDPARVTFKAYSVRAIPTTVLIGADGKVAAILYPDSLNAKHIEDLIGGRPVDVPSITGPTISLRGTDDSATAPLLDMIVRKSTGDHLPLTISRSDTEFEAKNCPIRSLLAAAYDIAPHFVVGEVVKDPTPYDAAFSVPDADENSFQALLPSLICTAFHVSARKELRETEGWVLKAPNGKPDALKATDSKGESWSVANGTATAGAFHMDRLAEFVGGVLHKPEINKTGLTGRFDVKVEYDLKRPESLLDGLRNLGFTLEPVVLPIEFLVVSKQ